MSSESRTYYFHKDRLPKGWSYPLGRSVLDAALQSAGVTTVLFVNYSVIRGSVKDVRYPPLRVAFMRDAPPSAASGKVDITVYAVPSSERLPTKLAIESQLGAICSWIRRSETAPLWWRVTEHVVAVEMGDDGARLVDPADH
jgi:hypothetical protein